MVNVIKMLYHDSQAQVVCESQVIKPFTIQTGVKQRCILSPFLFSLCIAWVIENAVNSKTHPMDSL